MIARRTLVASLLVVGIGCRHTVREGEREESFQPYASVRVGTELLRDFLTRRTALLVAGAVPDKVEKTAGSWNLSLALKLGEQAQVGLGTAVALTQNGYFLTAAHNLERLPIAIAVLKDGKVQVAEATVVWSGTPTLPEEDFAILKAPLAGLDGVEWDASIPASGTAIVSMGAQHGVCGGRVLEATHVEKDRLSEPRLLVVHDLPGLQGDSGGPVIGLDGRLIGINVLKIGNLTGSREGLAVRPDRGWVLSIIDGRR